MTHVVRCLDSVRLDPMTPALVRMFSVLEQAAQRLKRDLMVTCGRDGHPPTSAHFRGMGLDIRTKDLSEAQVSTLFDFVRDTLGPEFYVQYEVKKKPTGFLAAIATVNPQASAEHMHAQVRKGLAQWPT